ncbi:transposase [Burkholderia metallica]|uniref:transposase n=1 Tax=Burkholderia metallica TaxID=488729 RepID=UPI001CF1F062|nr:transposase [Burkholderia metallica]MCA8003491.1 transposase [Burkholderia metallica]
MLQTLTTTLRLLAKRWIALEDELKTLDAMLEKLTHQHAPGLRQRFGVGPYTVAILVTVAGDIPERLKNEAALAALCGSSPLQASSRKTVRHRLNRGGKSVSQQRFVDHSNGTDVQRPQNKDLRPASNSGGHDQ